MKKYLPWLSALIWLAAVGSGMGVLWVYDHTPGGDAGVPSQWPARSKMHLASDQPTLIMFAHPKCACTRASIGELAVLMTHCQNRVKAIVVFLRPKGTREDWLHTDLWRSAEAIPGVTAQADEGGGESRNFHVTTSGHVVLYDVDGKLLFSGGITSARGHFGDNAGRSDIVQWLHHENAGTETPVFGCSLLNPVQASNSNTIVCTP
jgi:hypothetical protein